MPKPMYVWSGSAWVSVASEVESLAGYATQSYADNTPGMKLIVPTSVAVGSGSGSVGTQGTVTFSGASSVSLNNVFSSTYKDYVIQLNFTGSTDNTFCMRLRNGTTDNSSANYYSVGIYQTIAASTPTGGSIGGPATYWWTGESRNGLQQSNVIHIHQPFDTAYTTMNQQQIYAGSVTAGQVLSTSSMSVTTSYTSFTLFPLTGTVTGTVSIYGYKNG